MDSIHTVSRQGLATTWLLFILSMPIAESRKRRRRRRIDEIVHIIAQLLTLLHIEEFESMRSRWVTAQHDFHSTLLQHFHKLHISVMQRIHPFNRNKASRQTTHHRGRPFQRIADLMVSVSTLWQCKENTADRRQPKERSYSGPFSSLTQFSPVLRHGSRAPREAFASGVFLLLPLPLGVGRFEPVTRMLDPPLCLLDAVFRRSDAVRGAGRRDIGPAIRSRDLDVAMDFDARNLLGAMILCKPCIHSMPLHHASTIGELILGMANFTSIKGRYIHFRFCRTVWPSELRPCHLYFSRIAWPPPSTSTSIHDGSSIHSNCEFNAASRLSSTAPAPGASAFTTCKYPPWRIDLANRPKST
eukprot:Gb_34564 [translate_table: standard]